MRRRIQILLTALFLGAVLGVGLLPAQTEPPESELSKLLGEANNLFRQANEASLNDPSTARDLYQRAALRYERIIRAGGIHNGKLFYNLGNAYFRSGDLGRAILNYRRAEVYLSGETNLVQNLAYARGMRSDKFEEKQETRVLKTLLFWHYDLSPRLRMLLLAFFSGVFWIGMAVRLFRGNWAPRTALIITGILAFLFLGSLLVENTIGASEQNGVIVGEQVIARKGDGLSYEPSFTDPLHAGTEFTLVEQRPDWYQIELPDGRRCWIPANSAGLVETPPETSS